MLNDNRMFWTGMPKVNITLLDGKVIGDITKETKLNATMAIVNGVADGGNTAPVSSFAGAELYSGNITIKGRGNSSWTFPKKPYAVVTTNGSFAKTAATPFGLPSDFDWVLLADYSDKTFIRNEFTNTLSYALGLPWASRGLKCVAYINGVKQGLYTFCEKVKAGPQRINIALLGKTQLTLPELSGGYVIEQQPFGQLSVTEGQFQDSIGKWFGFKAPDGDDIKPEQIAYMQGQWNTFLDKLYNVDFDDLENGYRSVIDADSFARFYLLNNLSKNGDSYIASWYTTKDRNNPKMVAGPGWDFNGTFGAYASTPGGGDIYDVPNIDMTIAKDSWVEQACPYYAKLLTDPYFAQLVIDVYEECLPAIHRVLADLEAFIPKLIATGEPAADRAQWPDILSDGFYVPMATYQDEVNRMLRFVKDRMYYFTRTKYLTIPAKSATVSV